MTNSKPATSPTAGGGANPANGCVAPCPLATPIVGTPVAIDPTSDSIVCRGGALVTQINDTGPDRACTTKHEESHIADWKGRYGPNLCQGVPDGQLPLGGDGYAEFLRQSECKAYKVGKACREEFVKSSAGCRQAGGTTRYRSRQRPDRRQPVYVR